MKSEGHAPGARSERCAPVASDYRITERHPYDPFLFPYLNHIQASWKRSLREDNDWFRFIEKDAYYGAYNRLITDILNRKTVVIRLALLNEDPDIVLGWSVTERKTLHYVYVKGNPSEVDARRRGIGTALLPKEFDTITHLTLTGLQIWKKKYKDVEFNPFK